MRSSEKPAAMRSHAKSPILALALAATMLAAPAARAAGQQDLLSAVQMLESGDYPKAALTFFDVAENSDDAEMRYRAEYYLVLALFRMGLPHSALTYDRIIIDQGPQHPYYLKAIENVLSVMDAVGDKKIIPSMLDKEYNDSFAKLSKTPEGAAVLHRINFLISLWSYNQKKWDDAGEFVGTVPADSAVYARALYLRGLDAARRAQSTGNDPRLTEEAAKIFNSVLALKNSEKVTYADLEELKELAQLGLARVRYAQAGYLFAKGDESDAAFGKAFDEYNKVPRFARHWRDALFEGAYAAFMAEDPGRALGSLQTLHAPVAGDQLVPESWLLRAHIYYRLCLFDDSKAALQKLQDTYTPIHDQVDALLESKREPEFYFNLLQNGSDGGTAMPVTVRNELLVDETIRGRRSYILELGREGEKLKQIEEFKRSDLVKILADEVEKNRNVNITLAGKTVQRDLARLKYDLEELDGQVEIVRLEMARREKDLLEASFDAQTELRKQTLYRPGMPAKGIEYWDFEGEYWPDELGFYRSTVKNACPAEQAAR